MAFNVANKHGQLQIMSFIYLHNQYLNNLQVKEKEKNSL